MIETPTHTEHTMSNHTITVIPRKVWKNNKTKKTASLYGATPFLNSKSQRDWSVVQVGYTVRICQNGSTRTGLASLPYNATKQEALEVALNYAILNSDSDCVVV